MRPTIISTPVLTSTLAASYLAAGVTASSIITQHDAPERLPVPTSTATGCLRTAEAPGSYLLTTTSIEPPVSDAIEPKDAPADAAEAKPPQPTEVPPPVPGGERAPEATRAEAAREVPGAPDDIVSLRLVFDRSVDASRYVGQRVEVKGKLENPDHPAHDKGDAGETGTRAGMAGSTETTGQTGSVSATGQTEQTSRDARTSRAQDTEGSILRVASVRMLSPRCEEDR